MNQKPRLSLGLPKDLVIGLVSEGHPGATNLCCDILADRKHTAFYPMIGGMGALLELDNLAIYGEELWVLYAYVCDQSLKKLIQVLIVCQMGGIDLTVVRRHIQRVETLRLDAKALATLKESAPYLVA